MDDYTGEMQPPSPKVDPEPDPISVPIETFLKSPRQRKPKKIMQYFPKKGRRVGNPGLESSSRNERGLTERQQAALVIMAKHINPVDGLKEIIRRNIIRSPKTYNDLWMRDPYWVRELNKERDRLHGVVRARGQALAIARVEKAINTIGDIADGRIIANVNQLQANVELCRMAGIDKPAATGGTINVFSLIGKAIQEQTKTQRVLIAGREGDIGETEADYQSEELDMSDLLPPGAEEGPNEEFPFGDEEPGIERKLEQ